MVELPLTVEVRVLWTVEPWQCQLWGAPEGGWIVLMNGADVAVRRHVDGVNEVRDTAEEWFARFSGELGRLGLAEPSRRYLEDRRKTPRGGRRITDK